MLDAPIVISAFLVLLLAYGPQPGRSYFRQRLVPCLCEQRSESLMCVEDLEKGRRYVAPWYAGIDCFRLEPGLGPAPHFINRHHRPYHPTQCINRHGYPPFFCQGILRRSRTPEEIVAEGVVPIVTDDDSSSDEPEDGSSGWIGKIFRTRNPAFAKRIGIDETLMRPAGPVPASNGTVSNLNIASALEEKRELIESPPDKPPASDESSTLPSTNPSLIGVSSTSTPKTPTDIESSTENRNLSIPISNLNAPDTTTLSPPQVFPVTIPPFSAPTLPPDPSSKTTELNPPVFNFSTPADSKKTNRFPSITHPSAKLVEILDTPPSMPDEILRPTSTSGPSTTPSFQNSSTERNVVTEENNESSSVSEIIIPTTPMSQIERLEEDIVKPPKNKAVPTLTTTEVTPTSVYSTEYHQTGSTSVPILKNRPELETTTSTTSEQSTCSSTDFPGKVSPDSTTGQRNKTNDTVPPSPDDTENPHDYSSEPTEDIFSFTEAYNRTCTTSTSKDSADWDSSASRHDTDSIHHPPATFTTNSDFDSSSSGTLPPTKSASINIFEETLLPLPPVQTGDSQHFLSDSRYTKLHPGIVADRSDEWKNISSSSDDYDIYTHDSRVKIAQNNKTEHISSSPTVNIGPSTESSEYYPPEFTNGRSNYYEHYNRTSSVSPNKVPVHRGDSHELLSEYDRYNKPYLEIVSDESKNISPVANSSTGEQTGNALHTHGSRVTIVEGSKTEHTSSSPSVIIGPSTKSEYYPSGIPNGRSTYYEHYNQTSSVYPSPTVDDSVSVYRPPYRSGTANDFPHSSASHGEKEYYHFISRVPSAESKNWQYHRHESTKGSSIHSEPTYQSTSSSRETGDSDSADYNVASSDDLSYQPVEPTGSVELSRSSGSGTSSSSGTSDETSHHTFTSPVDSWTPEEDSYHTEYTKETSTTAELYSKPHLETGSNLISSSGFVSSSPASSGSGMKGHSSEVTSSVKSDRGFSYYPTTGNQTPPEPVNQTSSQFEKQLPPSSSLSDRLDPSADASDNSTDTASPNLSSQSDEPLPFPSDITSHTASGEYEHSELFTGREIGPPTSNSLDSTWAGSDSFNMDALSKQNKTGTSSFRNPFSNVFFFGPDNIRNPQSCPYFKHPLSNLSTITRPYFISINCPSSSHNSWVKGSRLKTANSSHSGPFSNDHLTPDDTPIYSNPNTVINSLFPTIIINTCVPPSLFYPPGCLTNSSFDYFSGRVETASG